MPCRDDGYERGGQIEQQMKLDKVTRLLCEANKLLDDYESDADLRDRARHHYRTKEMMDWWQAHQEADRKRIAREQAALRREELRAKARMKLTAEERKALGIK